jgi:hypothetical protein
MVRTTYKQNASTLKIIYYIKEIKITNNVKNKDIIFT